MPALVISPELVLFFTAIVVLILDILFQQKRPKAITALALLGLFGALICTLLTFEQGAVELFSRSLMIDPVSQFFKLLLIFSGIMTVVLTWMSTEIEMDEKAEMYVLVILSTLAMCILSSAIHFLVLFLAFEAAAIASYVLAAFKRKSGVSSEAGVKLFVHTALTSILLAFGIVLLYGLGKSFNIIDIRQQLATQAPPVTYLWVCFGLIFTAVAARMAVFPFHFLAPDVYEGSPSPVSAFFSVSTNVAAAAVIFRLCIHIFSVKGDGNWTHLVGFDWPLLVAGVAAVTMTIGNLAAIHQTNLKRLIGYSCIAQMGYVLMGLVVLNHVGITAILFSLAAYSIVTMGTFFVIQMVTDQNQSEKISVLRGLVWRSPYEGVALCIFLLSLSGIPPLLGFVGKFYMLGVVVREKLYWLAIVGAINWVIGLTYYLSMIRQIFASRGHQSGDSAVSGSSIVYVALASLVVPTLALGIYWDPLMNSITRFLGEVSW